MTWLERYLEWELLHRSGERCFPDVREGRVLRLSDPQCIGGRLGPGHPNREVREARPPRRWTS
jgi:hypothetical protein